MKKKKKPEEAEATKAAAAEQRAEEATKAADSEAAAEPPVAKSLLTLADVGNLTGQHEVRESTIGGQTMCIVCFTSPKSHIAAPCGHQSVCAACSEKMTRCPYCREPVAMWMQQRLVHFLLLFWGGLPRLALRGGPLPT